MADYKNQHFVPRCLLRPFSLDGAGDSISLFNARSCKIIPNAALKNQCSSDYFYGQEDLSLEHALSGLEGGFDQTLRKLLTGQLPNEADAQWLYLFTFVQSRRTPHAIAEVQKILGTFFDKVYERVPNATPAPMPFATALHFSMKLGVQTQYIRDLKIALFRNRTPVDFIISDNPSVLTNRLHLQRMGKHNFGLKNSGLMFSLPLSPRLSMMLYDGGIYTADKGPEGYVDLKSTSDVHALNELQYVSMTANIYFRARPADPQEFALQVAATSSEREKAGPRARALVPHGDSENVFRVGTIAEEQSAGHLLIQAGPIFPRPSRWSSKMPFRGKMKSYSNGTAIGMVRKEEWLVAQDTDFPVQFEPDWSCQP